ncbi:MAG: tRNA (adenosine(37)-N6)-threonylcarbamoyltransferase complex transferase subunit TsaD [Dehalococcoidia bacterium]|nr:tRNA (adenosine(37)-N6)-threonylcarbamoyltransferase complex transferase subunit TsaD [Dehalococcoidia bacterium]
MKVLGIESSCDETACAVVENGRHLLASEVASQIELHARYGGVVPEVASRQHLLAIIPTIRQAMDRALTGWPDLDAIAVTRGPGLAGSLLVGVSVAKALALAQGKPLIGINHLEAHIYANWLSADEPEFPLLCLVVSGGHTDLILMQGHGDYTLLGRTRDDAAGEAFDKAARILDLGYPGGPAIDQAACAGTPTLPLPRAWLPGSYDFSFSGLKTALYRLAEESNLANVNDAAASFQEAVVEVLVGKTLAAAREHQVRQILLSGGVAANHCLRTRLKQESPLPVLMPPPALCTDNAAMVAACGYYHLRRQALDSLDMDVIPDLKLITLENKS